MQRITDPIGASVFDQFGGALAASVDSSDDGEPDLLIGSFVKDLPGAQDAGIVSIVASEADCDGDGGHGGTFPVERGEEPIPRGAWQYDEVCAGASPVPVRRNAGRWNLRGKSRAATTRGQRGQP